MLLFEGLGTLQDELRKLLSQYHINGIPKFLLDNYAQELGNVWNSGESIWPWLYALPKKARIETNRFKKHKTIESKKKRTSEAISRKRRVYYLTKKLGVDINTAQEMEQQEYKNKLLNSGK